MGGGVSVLKLIFVGRVKGSTCGGDCHFFGALEEDFVGIFAGCVLQQSRRACGLLEVDFGRLESDQTLSGLLWVLVKELGVNFAAFSEHWRWGF